MGKSKDKEQGIPSAHWIYEGRPPRRDTTLYQISIWHCTDTKRESPAVFTVRGLADDPDFVVNTAHVITKHLNSLDPQPSIHEAKIIARTLYTRERAHHTSSTRNQPYLTYAVGELSNY